MKTSKFFSVLSLALIFAVATSAFAGGIGKITTTNATVRYTVNIVLPSGEKPMNSSYQVLIFNENHRLVAPAQFVIPGQTQYVFFERGPVEGIRTAVLTKASCSASIEPRAILVADPCILKGLFEVGKTYRFDLYPKLQGDRD